MLIHPVTFSCVVAARSFSVLLSQASATAENVCFATSLRRNLSSRRQSRIDAIGKLGSGIAAFGACLGECCIVKYTVKKSK
ncbi:MAG: hypothetical protein ABW069_16370 [Duganella sp.]